MANEYVTAGELQLHLSLPDGADNDELDAIREAVSREIDNHCERVFYTFAGTRYFTYGGSGPLYVGDVLSVSAIGGDWDGDGVYEETWAPTDWRLQPVNAASLAVPYHSISMAPLGSYRFPRTDQGVMVTGVFGYAAAVPPVIRRACLLQCAMNWQATLAAGGDSVGTGEFAREARAMGLHPLVRKMLEPYRLKLA